MPKGKSIKRTGSGVKERKKIALGRGLDALIPGIESIENRSKEYFQCDIGLIRPNRYQPRLQFSEAELDDLCRSIKKQGILQPLLVRKDDIGYELAAGERRLRAAKKAGLKKVPVVVKDIADKELLEMSIVENIHREDLNPLEVAEAYHHFMTEFDLTQDQTAERVGMSRSAVANFLRIRQLPEQIKAGIIEGALSIGHARALLGAETPAQQNAAWRRIISKGLSVRQTERLIRRLKTEKKTPKKIKKSSEDIYISSLSDDLSRNLGTKVQIKRHGRRGKIEIEFYSNDDLDRLIGILNQ